MQVSASITIERDAQDVWDYVADVEMRHTWLEGLEKPHRTSEVASGAGAVYATRLRRPGIRLKVTYTVTQSEPPHRHAMRVAMPVMPFEALMDFAPEDGGAKVVYTMDTGSGGRLATLFTTVLGPLMRAVARRQLLNELRGLKAALEATGSA